MAYIWSLLGNRIIKISRITEFENKASSKSWMVESMRNCEIGGGGFFFGLKISSWL